MGLFTIMSGGGQLNSYLPSCSPRWVLFLKELSPFDGLSSDAQILVLMYLVRLTRNACWVKLLGFLNMIGVFWGRAYHRFFIRSVSSHLWCCTLIQCAGTLEPRIHWCVARTKVIPILILTYPHVREYSCWHFVARCMDILFRVSSTPTLINLSTDTKKGKNCWCCWRKSSRYIFFDFSASWRHVSGMFVM